MVLLETERTAHPELPEQLSIWLYKHMILYYNAEGLVKMRSDSRLETALESFDLVPTQEQTELIEKNYIIRIKNNEITFEKPPHIIEEEAVLAEITRKDELKNNIKNAKNMDELKDLIAGMI
jgi:hypothetical protein